MRKSHIDKTRESPNPLTQIFYPSDKEETLSRVLPPGIIGTKGILGRSELQKKKEVQ